MHKVFWKIVNLNLACSRISIAETGVSISDCRLCRLFKKASRSSQVQSECLGEMLPLQPQASEWAAVLSTRRAPSKRSWTPADKGIRYRSGFTKLAWYEFIRKLMTKWPSGQVKNCQSLCLISSILATKAFFWLWTQSQSVSKTVEAPFARSCKGKIYSSIKIERASWN